MDKRDLALQRSCPSICVPRFSAFEQSEVCGERVLVAANGVFLEVTRKWGHFIRKVGVFPLNTPLPYGEMVPFTQLAMEKLPRHLLEQFNELARQSSHVEIGASVVWNELNGTFRLLPSEAVDAGAGHLKYKLPDLQDGDHVVIDCHSHSKFSAFFSETDDADDRHAVKFSYVVGNCDQDRLSMKLRLCIKGLFENIPLSNLLHHENQPFNSQRLTE